MARSRIVALENLQQFTAINVLSDPGHIAGPVQIPSCAQIRIGWNLTDGKKGFNVLYGRYSGAFAGTVAQAQAMFTALSSGAAWTALAGFLHTTEAIASVDIRDVNTPNAALISSTGAAVPGTSPGTSLPSEVAEVITLRTAFVGPAFRGRLYLPPIASNGLGTGDTIAASAMTAMNNWAATIFTALSAQGYTWVLGQPARQQYTGSTGRVHPARAATSTTISTATVRDNHIDSQRRRGLK